MSFSNVSQRVTDDLAAAGWYPGRQIDLSHFQEKLRQAGYELFPAATEFMAEFGNLEVGAKRDSDSQYSWDFRLYVPDEAEIEALDSTGRAIDTRLAHVGRCNPSDLMILISCDAELYTEWSGTLSLVGTSAEEGLIAIASEWPPIREYWGHSATRLAYYWAEYCKTHGLFLDSLPATVLSRMAPETVNGLKARLGHAT
jgi:hypothetical protein